MRLAVYAGTFDPITRGHLSVIERAAPLFDQLIVLCAVNPEKVPLFTLAERLEMITEATCHLPNVRCDASEGWVVEYARRRGAQVLVRGVRGATDADAETALANANLALALRDRDHLRSGPPAALPGELQPSQGARPSRR